MYYRFSENLQGSAPWPPEYFNGVSEAVCSEKVRFLGGVFERLSQQAAEKGCSSAATMNPGGIGRVRPQKLPWKKLTIDFPGCRVRAAMALPRASFACVVVHVCFGPTVRVVCVSKRMCTWRPMRSMLGVRVYLARVNWCALLFVRPRRFSHARRMWECVVR